jgi:hypothetical protein
LGIKALTESRLASPNSFQFAIVLSVSRVSNSRSGLNIPDQTEYSRSNVLFVFVSPDVGVENGQ